MRITYKLLTIGCFLALFIRTANAQVTVEAPEQIGIGGEISITVNGQVEARSFVTLVPATTTEGEYLHYTYVKPDQVLQTIELKAMGEAGAFEIRLLGPNSPYPTIARKAIQIAPVQVDFSIPEQVDAGAQFSLPWTGPNNDLDYISIAEIGSADSNYLSYQYTRRGSPLDLTAPEAAGQYELRYVIGSDNTVVQSAEFSVGAVSANLKVPAHAPAGSNIDVEWTGPGNAQDFITIVESGAEERSYEHYVYTNRGSPIRLRVPETPGEYEVRYLTAQKFSTLAHAPIQVTATNASVTATDTAVASSLIDVDWTGPGNEYDYITIVKIDAPEGNWENYTYTNHGNPLKLRAPTEPGEYEIRYATGQAHLTLANTRIRITPAEEKPGTVLVTVANQTFGGVEVILDASGSMLQRVDGERRIEIAKNTLKKLTREVIPADTPFALRVFGREVDSCQTDLLSSLSPLNPSSIETTIESIAAKNNAKTPIADSLALVTSDLREVTGERLVILLTDGEETCGGNPAEVIKELTQSGTQVRVNIVGFAIDDQLLESTFQQWASNGGGHYFSAKNNDGLNESLQAALKPAFKIIDSDGNTVVEGIANEKPINIMPGEYQVHLLGRDEVKTISVTAERETAVDF